MDDQVENLQVLGRGPSSHVRSQIDGYLVCSRGAYCEWINCQAIKLNVFYKLNNNLINAYGLSEEKGTTVPHEKLAEIHGLPSLFPIV